MLVQQSHVLLVSDTEAVEEVVSVGGSELVAVVEGSQIGVQVIVLLDGLDNVALAVNLEELLGHDGISVMEGHTNVVDDALGSVQVGRVSEGTLGVGHGPGRGGHHSQVVVSVSVQGAEQSVLRRKAGTVNYTSQKESKIRCINFIRHVISVRSQSSICRSPTGSNCQLCLDCPVWVECDNLPEKRSLFPWFTFCIIF